MTEASKLPGSRPVAVLDLGSSAIRLTVAEVTPDRTIRILEEATRGVLLGKDTFTLGRISSASMEAALKALDGFRMIVRGYDVEHCRAVATSAVREATNRDTFLDRVRLRTGFEVEIIDGSEENRLTWLAVQEDLGEHEAVTTGNTVLAEVGGGSTDISYLRAEGPVLSGTYALGAIRMQQLLATWHGSHEERLRLLRRNILNVVDDIRREIPLKDATHFIALGGDMRFAAARILGTEAVEGSVRAVPRKDFESFCDTVSQDDVEALVDRWHLTQVDAETLVPALLAFRELLSLTSAGEVLVPEASLRAGLLLDLALSGEGRGIEDYSRQVLASAGALGQKYRYDEPHARNVASLAVRLFDELQAEHGLAPRDRLLLEVAALLHDVGMYVGIRGHHKHSQYILSVSDLFGLSREDMAIVANVSRYHRRSIPQKSHLLYMALDRETRLKVNKLAAILRVANALDADHLQKVREIRLVKGDDAWALEVDGAGDLTLERLATTALADLFLEVFGRKLHFVDAGGAIVSQKARRKKEKNPELFLNRELSWLEFNGRVLEEARDPSNPLLERLKFATIAASNLDEFFMVRVASLKNDVQEGEVAPDAAGLTPSQQLAVVAERAHAMVDALYLALESEILPGLVERGVRQLRIEDLDAPFRAAATRVFREEVLPALTPLAIDRSRPFPMLANLSLNVAVLLAPEPGSEEPRLAVVQVPGRLPRLVRLMAEDGVVYVRLQQLIREGLAEVFTGQTILDRAVFRIARDGELELDDEGGSDYLLEVEQEVRNRQRSRVVRLEVEARIGSDLLDALAGRLEVDPEDVYRIDGPLDPRALSVLTELPALEDLRDPPLRPLPPVEAQGHDDLFALLDQRELLLHHPYDSFDPVVDLVRQAADDPDVLAVKQTLYRTSGDSPIVRALMRCAAAGKQVTVIVELLARFDERSNIEWARRLEEAGAHVLYGIRGYKVHAKICLVVRRGPRGIRRYLHLGTGNYNDRTARLYTDFGLMTSDARTGEDASAFFNALTGYSDPPRMRRLAMAPTNLRERFLELIRREQRRGESGQAAEIRAKMNSLVDEEIIRALYDASGAGVAVRLAVRGICCLRPGLRGVSERIEVLSIVDRFLEHARIFYFRNGGDEEVYLSSADWMPRNLDRRIELLFPVEGTEDRQKVLRALDAMFEDNVKARWLQPDGTYRRRKPARGEEPFRSQIELYGEAKRTSERSRATAPSTFDPITGP